MSDITLTFGKHNGKGLSEIPRDYVEWLAENAFNSDVKQAAQVFLREHPATESVQKRRSSRQPGPAPRTYREASKLGWMAGKGYGNAKATLLAARDKDGFLLVTDEENDECSYYRLLFISENGTVNDAAAGFSELSYAQVEAILARYPLVEQNEYLVDVAEREAMEADQARRTLELRSTDGKHRIILCVWSPEAIDVTVDGRDQGTYRFRELNEIERRDPKRQKAAAILESDVDDPLGHSSGLNIGLTPERRLLVEQKIREVASEQGK